MKGQWSGLEVKSGQRFGEFGPSLQGGSGAQTVTSSLLQGRKLPTSSTGSSVLVVGRRGRGSARVHQPCPGPGSIFPGGLSPSDAQEEWCEVRCLLCQGKIGWGRCAPGLLAVTLLAYSFLPFNARTCADARTHTETP